MHFQNKLNSRITHSLPLTQKHPSINISLRHPHSPLMACIHHLVAHHHTAIAIAVFEVRTFIRRREKLECRVGKEGNLIKYRQYGPFLKLTKTPEKNSLTVDT